jgi:hypothetical protein
MRIAYQRAMRLPLDHSKEIGGWPGQIPEPQWEIYHAVMDEAAERGIPFALGGAFAVAAYTGDWRNTKDLDLYVLPENRERMVEVLSSVGLTDYFDEKPYDRWWIYRGHRGESIVDVIWAMANHRSQIDELWMSGPVVELRRRHVQVLPVEALLWDKLYILQRDRCDWQDVLNLLYSAGRDVNWPNLLERMGEDSALMAGALSVFRWLSPGRAQALPPLVWERLQMPPMPASPLPEIESSRVSLLDRRPWYGPDRERARPAA